MVCISMCADYKVQLFYLLTFQIGFHCCSLIVISRINQHIMSSTFNQSTISLSYIDIMHGKSRFSRSTRRLCILLAASAKKQAEHYHQKYSYYIFSIHYYSPNQFSLISFSIASISSLNSREETLLAPCPIIISCSSASDVTTVTLCFLLSSCVVFSI